MSKASSAAAPDDSRGVKRLRAHADAEPSPLELFNFTECEWQAFRRHASAQLASALWFDRHTGAVVPLNSGAPPVPAAGEDGVAVPSSGASQPRFSAHAALLQWSYDNHRVYRSALGPRQQQLFACGASQTSCAFLPFLTLASPPRRRTPRKLCVARRLLRCRRDSARARRRRHGDESKRRKKNLFFFLFSFLTTALTDPLLSARRVDKRDLLCDDVAQAQAPEAEREKSVADARQVHCQSKRAVRRRRLGLGLVSHCRNSVAADGMFAASVLTARRARRQSTIDNRNRIDKRLI
jgi:hypothetical protein